MQNHFELFHLPQRFAVDADALDAAYREVQGRVHPDRFVSATDAEKRVAMQWATRANEAYQTLKNPQKRAAYLCELNGVSLDMESNTAMPVEFLMQQMEWREALDEARAERDSAALEALDHKVKMDRKARMMAVGQHLDAEEYTLAAQGVRALSFIDKFADEVRSALDSLDS
ncbi:MAG TPA: Fe-S protein assembly co-chaperone HscB [Telluria sp.]